MDTPVSCDFNNAEHIGKVLRNLSIFYNKQELCDVVLATAKDGKKISAHRNVLAAASDYFAKMFTGAMRESNEKVITLCDVDGDMFELLVNYMYTGRINLHQANVQALLYTSNLLQLTEVFDACCDFLKDQLDPSNCLAMESLAEQFGCKALSERSFAYACKHFAEVNKTEDFMDLSADRLGNLLKSDLVVSSEEGVFHAVMSWLHHDLKDREPSLPELLECVRLPLLPSKFIFEYVEPLRKLVNCDAIVREAIEWHQLPEKRSEISPNQTRPRKSGKGLVAICRSNEKLLIEKYCPILNEWSLVKSISNDTHYYSEERNEVAFQNKLFILGGFDQNIKSLNLVDCLDLDTMEWSSLKPINTPRHGAGVAILNDLLYAIGGYDQNGDSLNSVERYDPTTNTWSNVAPMFEARGNSSALVLNDCLYVIGGETDLEYSRSVECYDPNTNIWHRRADMKKARSQAAVAALNGFIYVVEGFSRSDINSVERYDPKTNAWTTIAALNFAHELTSVAIIDENLIVLAGFDDDGYVEAVEKYDPKKDKWILQSSLNCIKLPFKELREKKNLSDVKIISIS